MSVSDTKKDTVSLTWPGFCRYQRPF